MLAIYFIASSYHGQGTLTCRRACICFYVKVLRPVFWRSCAEAGLSILAAGIGFVSSFRDNFFWPNSLHEDSICQTWSPGASGARGGQGCRIPLCMMEMSLRVSASISPILFDPSSPSSWRMMLINFVVRTSYLVEKDLVSRLLIISERLFFILCFWTVWWEWAVRGFIVIFCIISCSFYFGVCRFGTIVFPLFRAFQLTKASRRIK